DSHQILRLAQVDDIVGPSRYHVDRFNLISADLKLHHLSGMNVPLLDETMSCHYDKQFPFGIMPVLAFCDPRLADINADLSTIGSMYQFRKASAVITVHFQ